MTNSTNSINNSNAAPPLKQERLFNRGIITTANAQFFSAFADNALFFALLELLQHSHYGRESSYILQGSFLLFYIALAPIVGFLADNIAKSKILMWGNGLKIVGVLLLFIGASPFLSYAFVGLGAAIYSPAKFGILSQFVTEKLLIKANGLIEGSTIIAILSGAALGGFLAEKAPYYAIFLTLTAYLLATLFNLLIPTIHVKNRKSLSPPLIWHIFITTLKILFKDHRARFAIMGTALFWAGVATLKLLLNDWVRERLGGGTEMVSQLSVIVGIGVIIGTLFAALFIRSGTLFISLLSGIFMALLIFLFLLQESYLFTIILLLLIGACGGAFLIPLNALLQTRGSLFKSVGSAIAIQNLCENSVMLLMIGLFGALASFSLISIQGLMALFALLFLLSVMMLFVEARRYRIFARQ
ncbi:lysophospholipid transporter LplT [Ignatzschineria sp. F8392]|nr:lysophospholipid transporter LplT [Ignatzschineria sp. F8392]